MNTLRLTITEAHCLTGSRCDSGACPTANALLEQLAHLNPLYTNVAPCWACATFDEDDEAGYRKTLYWNLPVSLQEAILNYDAGASFPSGTYELTEMTEDEIQDLHNSHY